MVEIVMVSQDSELPAGLAGSFLRTLKGRESAQDSDKEN